MCHIDSEGHKGRRYIDIVEGSGHGILAADGCKTVTHLCLISTEQSGKRLAPALRILCHSAEILLEGKMNLPEITAGSHYFCHGLRDSVNSTMIRAPAGQVRIKAIGHHGHGRCIALQHRHFGNHCLCLGQLVFAAVRHEHTGCTDGGVEHLHKALLRAGVQIRQGIQPLLSYIADVVTSLQRGILRIRNVDKDICLLMCAVRVKEGTGDIDDILSSPVQHKAGLFRDDSHFDSLKVLLSRIIEEFIRILRAHDNSHALLRFGDRKLCTIEAGIFFRNLVQIHGKAGCQFADGNGNTAGTEVIALLDDLRHLRAAEHSLQLALGRCITFLHLCAAGLQRLGCVNLR